MSNLTSIEKKKLEKFFDMGSGYVLDFSNRTFIEFIDNTLQINIYDDKYNYESGSKANRLRRFWNIESNYKVGKLTKAMLEFWRGEKFLNTEDITPQEQNLYDECMRITSRLLQSAIVEEIEVINDNTDDRDFNLLAKSIKESIEKNEPEVALDRLHTYMMKFIRQLCQKHEVQFSENESLNALFGKYVKFILSTDKVDSKMAEKILKYSVNVLDAFNDIRNNKSLAHDNPILNYSESVLIFNNVTNSIKFIETVEQKIDLELKTKQKEEDQKDVSWEDLPF